jgi:hypothetical protein
MTEQQAEKVATVLLGVAAAGAVFYILKTPALRRMAWGLARTAITTGAPALMAEARRVWDETGHRETPHAAL